MKISKIFLMLAVMAPLAACGGGEPGDKQIKQALSASLEEVTGQMGGVVAAGMLPEIMSVEKIACVEAKDAAGYQCDVKVVMKMAGREVTQTDSARFVKGDNGWQVIR